MDNLEAFWNRVRTLTLQKHKLETVEFFLDPPTKVIDIRGNEVIILVENMKAMFLEHNLPDIILTAGFEFFNRELHMHLIQSLDELEVDDGSQIPSADFSDNSFDSLLPTVPYEETNLRQKYTFDNYIQGEGNKMARGAALAVSGRLGGYYSPLFIYGGSGLGKTHLLNAIGNETLLNFPHSRVKYIATENFLNDFTKHIRLNDMDSFRETYRNLDLLLIDDVQFLSFGARKVETEKELFNIFEALQREDKQIVLTSDRSPDHLDNIDVRLKSRFAWGVTIDVTPPDFETRLAIIKSKVEKLDYDFPPETIEYIASQFDSNVRELEGAINDITFFADINQITTISLDVASQALRARKQEVSRPKVISIDRIQEEVGKFYGISVKELKGSRRVQNIVLARQVAMYLSRELTDNSLPKIGRSFGGKDHTTVMHAYTKIKSAIESDKALELEIEDIRKKIRS